MYQTPSYLCLQPHQLMCGNLNSTGGVVQYQYPVCVPSMGTTLLNGISIGGGGGVTVQPQTQTQPQPPAVAVQPIYSLLDANENVLIPNLVFHIDYKNIPQKQQQQINYDAPQTTTFLVNSQSGQQLFQQQQQQQQQPKFIYIQEDQLDLQEKQQPMPQQQQCNYIYSSESQQYLPIDVNSATNGNFNLPNSLSQTGLIVYSIFL